jgi:hypothetical protein
MNNTEELKSIIKERWLDYYEINQDWIVKFTNANSGWVKCPAGGSRPSALIILGAITCSDSRLVSWMSLFCELHSDPDKLIKVLELDFDPDEEVKIRIKQREEENSLTQTAEVIGLLSEDLEYKAANEGLNQIREQIKQDNSS